MYIINPQVGGSMIHSQWQWVEGAFSLNVVLLPQDVKYILINMQIYTRNCGSQMTWSEDFSDVGEQRDLYLSDRLLIIVITCCISHCMFWLLDQFSFIPLGQMQPSNQISDFSITHREYSGNKFQELWCHHKMKQTPMEVCLNANHCLYSSWCLSFSLESPC